MSKLALPLLLACLAFDVHGADDPLPRREARHVWTAKLGERPSGGPWLAGDAVYYFFYSGRLVSLSAASGDIRWEARIPGSHVTEPVHEGRMLYVAAEAPGLISSRGQVIALHQATGKAAWTAAMPTQPQWQPLIAGDVLVITLPREWRALDRVTGKELWRLQARTEAGTVEAVLGGSTLLLGEYGGPLHAVDAQTGKERWRFLPAPKGFPRGEVFAEEAARGARTAHGREFLTTTPTRAVYAYGIGMCRALLQGQGEDQVVDNARQFLGPDVAQALLAAARISICPGRTTLDAVTDLAREADALPEEGVTGPPGVAAAKVFVRTLIGYDLGSIYALDLATGEVLMRRSTAGSGGRPAGDERTVYFMSSGRTRRALTAIDIASGKEAWSTELGKSHLDSRAALLLSDRFVYVENARFDRDSGAMEWPMPFNLDRHARALPACTRVSTFSPVARTWTNFVSAFDFGQGRLLWTFPVALKSWAYTVACDKDSAFYYDDWADHPLYGAMLQPPADAR